MGIDNLDKIGSEIQAEQGLSDNLAKQELQKKFSGDDKRSEETKQAIHCGIIWFIRVAAIIVTIVFIVRMAYFVIPTSWRWLQPDEVKALDEFLFHGMIGGILGAYLKKSIKAQPEE